MTTTPSTRKSERTRRRILDAAASALASSGYGATSLKTIAATIDMQDASLYYHFASKDDLVLEVLRIGTELAHDAVLDAIDGIDVVAEPVRALEAAIVAHATAVLGGGDYPRANVRNFGQLPSDLAERHRAQHRDYGDVWRRLIDAAGDAGLLRTDIDPTAMRMLILGALNWAIEWYDDSGDLDPETLGRQLTTMVLRGALVDESSGIPTSNRPPHRS